MQAVPPHVLPAGEPPQDRRLEPLKDLDDYFPFVPPESAATWVARAERVRRQVLVATGLWPMPEKSPLHPVIHGAVQRDGYTVEKVFFESVPGFFVTGNLYRPKGRTGRNPAVLSPHGHWPGGRFIDNKDHIREEIGRGAERFEEGGRSMLQARCVQLARMGCVVFHYDMIGYADSQQIPFAVAHQPVAHRPKDQDPAGPGMNTTENWGLFTAQSDAHLQSVMGLQTWNSIRALDFLASLPEVDPQRIGVTGESGGGTQTFILCAIDPRPAAAFPAVMVSTAMQGGCTCENTSLLRIDTGNVEIAALFAPKPLGLTAADDWTKEMPAKGFPELQQLYRRLGAAENVMLKPLLQFPHNYNYVSRAAMYSWFNQHLQLGRPEPIVEEDYRRLTTAELSVWDSRHPKPPGGPEFERRLLHDLAANTARQLQTERASIERYRKTVGPAVDVLIGRNLSAAGAVEFTTKEKTDGGEYWELSGLLRNRTYGEELPVVLLQPKAGNGNTVVWLEGRGKAALYEPGDAPGHRVTGEIRALLDSGCAVIGADLLHQGEFLPDGKPIEKTRRVTRSLFAGYTFGYNHPVFARRVHDILGVVKFAQKDPRMKTLAVVGLGGAGPLVAAARAQCGDAIGRAVIATDGFRWGKLLDVQDLNFLPGGAKYDDLPGMLALGAPGKLWLAGEAGEDVQWVTSLYRLANATKQFTLYDGSPSQVRPAAVQWLLGAD